MSEDHVNKAADNRAKLPSGSHQAGETANFEPTPLSTDGRVFGADNLIMLQRLVGNRRTQRMLRDNQSPKIQRMKLKLPVIPPEDVTIIDPNSLLYGQTQTIVYVDDTEIEIESDEALKAHIPDMPVPEREYFRKKLSQAHAQYYLTNAFAQDAIQRIRQHINNAGYGITQKATRLEILKLYNQLTTPAHGVNTPAFQATIQQKYQPLISAIDGFGEVSTSKIDSVHRELQNLHALKGKGNGAKNREEMFGQLHQTGHIPYDVPPANHNFPTETVTHGAYTAAKSVKSWVSIHGATYGNDIVGWETTSDLNYKYGLIQATNKKLIAGHLLPGLLGGRPESANLTPITNEANGWLASNPEKYAKDLLYSQNLCIQYEVGCTFDRTVSPPLNEDIQNLIPNTFKVRITVLQFMGGNTTEWQYYQPIGQSFEYSVPGGLMELDTYAMSYGVKQNWDRWKVKDGLR